MKFINKRNFIIGVIFSVLMVVLIVFIFSQSLKSAVNSSVASGRVVAFLNGLCSVVGIHPFFTQAVVRPLAHFSEFGLLGVISLISLLCFFRVKAKSLIASFAVFTLTAVCDECIQMFSDGRAFEFTDILIDVSGGLLGSVAVFIIAMLIHNRKNSDLEKEYINGKG